MAGSTVVWRDQATLIDNLRHGHEKLMRAAEIATNRMAPEVENYMKMNAPWTDQTANARNGLAARAYRDREEIGIVQFHQVPYGIYLETRWNGRYAIIAPTQEEMGPKVMSSFDRILERM